MNHSFEDHLKLLEEMQQALASLSALERQKVLAVRSNDLEELNRIMNLEQAASLKFRGFEQRQGVLLAALGLEGIPLSGLADQFPPELRLRASQLAEGLRTQYRIYCGSAEVARNTLECNLHEIDKLLSGNTAPQGPGYEAPDPQLPPKMKTDFRA